MIELRPFDKDFYDWDNGIQENEPNEEDYCCQPDGCGEHLNKCICWNEVVLHKVFIKGEVT